MVITLIFLAFFHGKMTVMKHVLERTSILTAILLTSYSLFLTPVRAQSVPTAGGIELSASSQNPVPGQTITITANNFSADINSSKVTWTVNGKIIESGTGLSTLDIVAPAAGKTLAVKATMTTTDGISYSNTYTVRSGSVDMILETNGYVPPLFKGKLTPVYQNEVRIIAIPHLADSTGREYDPTTLIYIWKKDGSSIQEQSGYGKQSISLLGDIVPRAYDVSVTISTKDGSVQAQGIINVSFQSPTVNFYVNDQLYGPLFNIVAGDTVHIGSQKETDVLAVPYGFTKPVGSVGNLVFTWLINNIEHPELSSSDSIILRAPDNTTGSSDVSLSLHNNDQILQSANGDFSAIF
jgi:hypothetical protein